MWIICYTKFCRCLTDKIFGFQLKEHNLKFLSYVVY
jgi:hypothetical protein